jgi:hypothetical protein
MEVLRVSDDTGFHTIAEACNATMGCNYKGIQKAFFRPRGLVANDIDMLAWFSKLFLDGKRVHLDGMGQHDLIRRRAHLPVQR